MTTITTQDTIAAQLHARLTDTDPEIRRIALMDLVDSEDEALAVPLLIAALKDADGNVRAEAAAALEGFESEEVVTALLDILTDSDPKVCAAAALSLG